MLATRRAEKKKKKRKAYELGWYGEEGEREDAQTWMVRDDGSAWMGREDGQTWMSREDCSSKVGREGGPARIGKIEEYDLKFIDAPERDVEAASQKSLNNKPAWMSSGLGVNTSIFGESKGNLMKPGLYEEDLARIEATKGNPLGDGPDPFGDVFNGRDIDENLGSEIPANTWRCRAPLPAQDECFSGSKPMTADDQPPRPVIGSKPVVSDERPPAVDIWSLL